MFLTIRYDRPLRARAYQQTAELMSTIAQLLWWRRVSIMILQLTFVYFEQNYHQKSATTQILCDPGLTVISYNGQKFHPYWVLNQCCLLKYELKVFCLKMHERDIHYPYTCKESAYKISGKKRGILSNLNYNYTK